MKKNSALSFALISAMLFTGLTGCGTDESSEETLNNTVSETAAETEAPAEEAPAEPTREELLLKENRIDGTNLPETQMKQENNSNGKSLQRIINNASKRKFEAPKDPQNETRYKATKRIEETQR